MSHFSYIYSIDLDEVAHYEPPHQDLRCLQIQLLLSLVLKELTQTQTCLLVSASSQDCPSYLASTETVRDLLLPAEMLCLMKGFLLRLCAILLPAETLNR